MKKIAILLLITASLSTQAQTLSSKIYGDWKATCVLEKIDTNTVDVCPICPYEPEDSKTLRTITFNFGNEELVLITPTSSTTVPIQYNEKLEHLVFIYNGSSYDFSVLYVDVLSKIILKSQNGNILYLERKNNLRSK